MQFFNALADTDYTPRDDKQLDLFTKRLMKSLKKHSVAVGSTPGDHRLSVRISFEATDRDSAKTQARAIIRRELENAGVPFDRITISVQTDEELQQYLRS